MQHFHRLVHQLICMHIVNTGNNASQAIEHNCYQAAHVCKRCCSIKMHCIGNNNWDIWYQQEHVLQIGLLVQAHMQSVSCGRRKLTADSTHVQSAYNT